MCLLAYLKCYPSHLGSSLPVGSRCPNCLLGSLSPLQECRLSPFRGSHLYSQNLLRSTKRLREHKAHSLLSRACS